ncbi:MAG: hypothetical protein E7535_09105 [Ruminococcaceae bacterium]|nr:hypothetical protein [Oscillospiraceae bacterium]
MDIGNLKNNYTYYEGYEDEGKIVLCIEADQAIHIWEGYFDDIYDTPTLDGNGWKGFTRDYHQFEGVFSEDGGITEIDPSEYLEDLMLYKEKSFEFEETTEVFNLMVSFLEEAIKQGVNVITEKV